jgi:hypothetical protein
MIGAIPVIAENRIREAMEQGEFENLEGASRPFRDLDGHDAPDWWVTQKLQRERLSAEDAALLVKESRL